jgi:hypothetical protein
MVAEEAGTGGATRYAAATRIRNHRQSLIQRLPLSQSLSLSLSQRLIKSLSLSQRLIKSLSQSPPRTRSP